MKRSVGLRQPRLDCAVVMSHEPINKGFRSASLASVHCHSTATITIVTGKLGCNNDDSELLVKSFFLFSSRKSEDRHEFYYETECWFTPAKTGLCGSHES
jgi:hypothetical protein